MKKIIIMLTILLGGIANAQTFDFSCEPDDGIITSTDGTASFDPNSYELIIDGETFTLNSDRVAWSAPNSDWNEEGLYLTNPYHSATGVNWLFNNEIGQVLATRVPRDDFDAVAATLRSLKYQALEHHGVVYNSLANTFSVDGLTWERRGDGHYYAPDGWYNNDEVSYLRFEVNGNTYRGERQVHNGNGDVFASGENYISDYSLVAGFLSSHRASSVFFVDRDGPSVNHRRLTNWEHGSGFTSQDINGQNYPGVIRFTENGDNWDVYLIPNGSASSKLWEINRSEANVINALISLLRSPTSYQAAYDAIP